MKKNDDKTITFGANIRLLKRLMIVFIVLVVATGSFCNFMIYQVIADPESSITKALFRFDLGHEPSFPNFFSALLLLSAAILSFVCGHIANEKKPRFAWKFMGVIFLLLSVDENIMVHETLNRSMSILGLDAVPVIFPWTIAGLLFAGTIGFVALPVFKDLSKKHAILVATSGCLFILGALGVENLAAYVFHLSGGEEEGVKTIAHWALQTVEESLEMFGVCLYLFVMIDHVRESKSELQVKFK